MATVYQVLVRSVDTGAEYEHAAQFRESAGTAAVAVRRALEQYQRHYAPRGWRKLVVTVER